MLHSEVDGRPTAGRIVEVEAYRGPVDLAAHSAGGRRTPRNEIMYARGGHAYVYQIYGLHHCVNVVVGEIDVPEAVLLRALEPVVGIETMRDRRGADVPDDALARGPGNLTRALGIDRSLDGTDLRRGVLRLTIPAASLFPLVRPSDVVRSPRIGIDYAGEWASKPWRLSLRDHPCVSRPPRRGRGRTVSGPTSRSAPRARPPGRSSPR